MCDARADGNDEHERKRCLFGKLINGYIPVDPMYRSGSGAVWKMERPEGLSNHFPEGWFCPEHHEELLLLSLRGPIPYDAVCFARDIGRYEVYVEKGRKESSWK